MDFWLGVVAGILIAIIANLVTPRLSTNLIKLRDRFLLNRLYYVPQFQIRSISDIDQVSLTSGTFKLRPAGNGVDTYALQFLISCTRSKKLADYLSKHELCIGLTFAGIESVKFYPIDLKTHNVYYKDQKEIIEFGPEEFNNPRDAFYSALIFTPSNLGNFTISFSYSLKKTNSIKKENKVDKVKSLKIIFKNATTFDSLNTDTIKCEKI